MTDADSSIERLTNELTQARSAAREAEARAGEAEAELRSVSDQLRAAELSQAEWDTLIGHIEAERAQAADVAAELAAVRASKTWQVGSAVLAPYRRVRGLTS